MSTIRHHFCRPLIALVAIFAASMAADDASGCTALKPSDGRCATVCGCCATDTNATSRADSSRGQVAPHAIMACESGGNLCVCRSREPADPAPKPARSTTDNRPELSQGSGFVDLSDELAAHVKPVLAASAIHDPPKTPLYLRNERLLF